MITDVLVIGGGPAGTVAAIAAARSGAKTLLVEKKGFLGGSLTGSGVGPMMTFHAGKTQVVQGIPEEIVGTMVKRGFSPGHMEDYVGYASSITPFDAEGLKLCLEEMAIEAGVQLLYHTSYAGCCVKSSQIESIKLLAKNGFTEAKAKIYIDASADADLAFGAGISCVYGRESDNLAQPATMNMKVYNVDSAKLIDFILENKEDMRPETLFDKLKELPRTGLQGAYSLVKLAHDRGEFNVPRDLTLLFETNNRGEFIINITRINKVNALDPFDLTRAEIEGRRQAHETLKFLKKYIGGFENAVLASTGPEIGIRESRKIDGIYKLTGDDLINCVMFEDAVSMGGYPIDIHSPDGGETNHRFLIPGSWYSIPYRSLITKEISNLIVAGRCISATHEACAAIRCTPVLMGISQGAGTAAAIAAMGNKDVKDIDIALLRGKLKEDGAFLEVFHKSNN